MESDRKPQLRELLLALYNLPFGLTPAEWKLVGAYRDGCSARNARKANRLRAIYADVTARGIVEIARRIKTAKETLTNSTHLVVGLLEFEEKKS